MKEKSNIFVAFLLIVSLLISGCAYKVSAASNLMSDITIAAKDSNTPDETFNDAMRHFSGELLKNCVTDKENTLVSPLSVYYALSLAANGADNNTRIELENALGLKIEDINKYLLGYKDVIKDSAVVSNAIWFEEGFDIKKDFLQTAADYYGADAYSAKFDKSTVDQINEWVSNETDGMIKKIINDLAPNSHVYLLNALTFDQKWQSPYYKSDIVKRDFKNANGKKTKVEFLNSDEFLYICDDKAEGFIKRYEGGNFAFCALLPNEDTTVDDYAKSLGANKIKSILEGCQKKLLEVSIPKFEAEFGVELIPALKNMEIYDAFSENADFSKLSDRELFISEVLHKTYISVDENGTKAAAVTSIAMSDKSAPVEAKRIYLDRPFVYMIIDCNNNIPIFIGTLNSI